MPAPRAVPHRSLTLVVLAGMLAALGLPALAEPSSDEVRDRLETATQRLDDIEEEVSAVVEDYNEAQMVLERVGAELAEAQGRLDDLSAEAEVLREVVGDHARQLHKLGPTVELSTYFVAADPAEASDRTAVLRRLLDGQQADLERLIATLHALEATEDQLAAAQDEAEEWAAEVEHRREELEITLASYEDEVATLQGELRQAEEREEAEARRREEERRQREAERRRLAELEQASEQEEVAEATVESAPAVRKSAQVAVDTALAQLGKPYRYGGSGPSVFDCSGLTSFAWRAAGVSLPRSSRAQYAGTTRISRSELQPGDLVFYHDPISHVAMYIGDGKVVEAPYSGNNVRIRHDGLTRRGVVGYGRP